MGGSTPSPSTQTQQTFTNQQQGPNPVIAQKLENVGQANWDWYNNNQTPPSWMNTAGPESAQTLESRNLLYNTAGSYLNNTPDSGAAQGRQFALDTIGGKYLNPDTNTAYQKYLEASFRPQAEQFRDILAPTIDAKFSGAGRPGSGAHFDTEMRGYQDLARSQSDAAAKTGLALYQGERANQNTAANMLPQFQNMDFAAQNAGYRNIAAMQAAAQQGDAYAQRVLDDAVAQHRYEATAQPDWYTQMAQRIQGIYPGGASSGSGNTYGTGSAGGGDGGTGNLLGAGFGAAGLGLKAASMLFPATFASDARLKDVHARVGFTDDGIPLFLYKYKGSSEPRIGPMAQHVAKVKPEAVSEHPSGYLMVDGNALVPQGGLL